MTWISRICIVKKFTISSLDAAWFLCENAKICQDMAYESPRANALSSL